MKSRGFFFTLLVAIALAFMVISLALWSAVIVAREEKTPTKFQVQAIVDLADSVSKQKLERLSSLIGYRALYSLVEDVRLSGRFVNSSKSDEEICSVLTNGTRLNGSKIFYGSLQEWSDQMKNASKRVGFNWELNFSSSACSAVQNDPWIVSATFTGLHLKISNEDGSMNISRFYPSFTVAIPIRGIEDPLITLKDAQDRGVSLAEAHIKQIYPSPYARQIDLAPVNLVNGTKGKGWTYGITTDNSGGSYANDRYILVITSTAGVCDGAGSCSQLNNYAGVILIGSSSTVAGSTTTISCAAPAIGTCSYTQVTEAGNCLDCLSYYAPSPSNPSCCPNSFGSTSIYNHSINVSFIQVKPADLSVSDLQISSGVGLPVLLNSPSWSSSFPSGTPPKIWDIEKLRDFAVCGYYLMSSDAPAFLQRLEGNVTALGGTNGIESFVVGQWAREDRPKIDHVYYTGGITQNFPVKGMPGCKNAWMCAGDSPVGRFSVDLSHAGLYGIPTDMLCMFPSQCSPP